MKAVDDHSILWVVHAAWANETDRLSQRVEVARLRKTDDELIKEWFANQTNVSRVVRRAGGGINFGLGLSSLRDRFDLPVSRWQPCGPCGREGPESLHLGDGGQQTRVRTS